MGEFHLSASVADMNSHYILAYQTVLRPISVQAHLASLQHVLEFMCLISSSSAGGSCHQRPKPLRLILHVWPSLRLRHHVTIEPPKHFRA